jgi:hypothetical protein
MKSKIRIVAVTDENKISRKERQDLGGHEYGRRKMKTARPS